MITKLGLDSCEYTQLSKIYNAHYRSIVMEHMFILRRYVDLFEIARRYGFLYKKCTKDVVDIVDSLGADHLLEDMIENNLILI